ncbi:pilus assembly protein TadG-related protein [Desulfovibrio inopinatus]|uniref:pilus assembly protein TadG-related protein n=1 Tax=Desulfovibrio inopinatus TaxID=102109 RepID=UPI000407270B|nr:pilus assembly protein TadG-related protein [Desulfovibrio inopinatus]
MIQYTALQKENQGGMVVVMAALALVALAGFSAFAVDYGLIHYKKSQLQTAADSAAMAGASVLMASGGDVNEARTAALDYARRNLVSADNPTSAVVDADVIFYRNGTQTVIDPNQIEVAVGLEADRGNALDMVLARVLGKNETDIEAVARAESFCSDASSCLKPFSPPAKFTFDDSCDSNKKYKNNGLLDPDSACEVASVSVQGYSENDIGAAIVLKLSSLGDAVNHGQYYPIDYPALNRGTPVPGASMYRTNIQGCQGSNQTQVFEGDTIQVEPGNMVGPTKQGVEALIAQDPGAYWDSASDSIKGSIFDDPLRSPRVVAIPFFDPTQPPSSGRNMVVVHQLAAVFIESYSKHSEVMGRFIRGLADSPNRSGASDCLLASVGLALDSTRLQALGH